jgi:hypothetical protein
MNQRPQYSLLRAWTLRPLPVALAHRLADTEAGEAYMAMLSRLYAALPASDRAICHAELACRDRQMVPDHFAGRSHCQWS